MGTKEQTRAHYEANRELYIARSTAWRKNNPERYRQHMRKAALRKNYGMTLEEYDALVAKQEGRCAICGTTPKRLVVDHDHETGRVRGLLCDWCNGGLAYLDREGWLETATGYKFEV